MTQHIVILVQGQSSNKTDLPCWHHTISRCSIFDISINHISSVGTAFYFQMQTELFCNYPSKQNSSYLHLCVIEVFASMQYEPDASKCAKSSVKSAAVVACEVHTFAYRFSAGVHVFLSRYTRSTGGAPGFEDSFHSGQTV